MSTNMPTSDESLSWPEWPLSIRQLDLVPAPWAAFLLPVSGFPMKSVELNRCERFLQRFGESLITTHGLQQDVLLGLWKLSPENGADVLADNVEEWSPDFGLGVWPNRKPPRGWTEESMMDAAAAVMRGDEPEMPSHRLLRLASSQASLRTAASKMRGFGLQVQAFHRTDWTDVVRSGQESLLPMISDPGFRREDFYFPLLDSKSIQSAKSRDVLDSWMCEINVYIRESPEDKAVLILSSLHLPWEARHLGRS